jgi:hypothetical protein
MCEILAHKERCLAVVAGEQQALAACAAMLQQGVQQCLCAVIVQPGKGLVQ